MKKKAWTLKLLLAIAPLLPTVIVLQSILVSWAPVDQSGTSPATRWLAMLGPLCTLAGAVLSVAFGGPLLADKIKTAMGKEA